MATEMAKLSLWLITLAKNRPFTFLDHALRSGDSLLGANERQLLNWSMDARPGEVTQSHWGLSDVMRRSLETALKLRRQLQQLPERDVRDIEAKDRLLQEADRAMEIVKLGADLLVAITLSEPKRRSALQDTLGVEYSVLVKAYEEAHYSPMTDQGRAPIHSAYVDLSTDVDELLNGRNPFHWPLEFPEVFAGKSDDVGFDSIMSNPPFIGGQKITGNLGTDYRDYLVEHIANGKRGSADLCAYFFLRATSLVQQNGMCALLATNTIAQGDTREVGLDQITASGWTIPRAIPSRKWPGEASIEVACIWLRNGSWEGISFLDQTLVSEIASSLTPVGIVQGKPYRLYVNANKSFMGAIVHGKGFILSPEEAQILIEKDQRNCDVLYPFLNGEDVNSRPDQSPSRWVINFHDWPLERAETYPVCMKIVLEKVKPERDLLFSSTDTSARASARFWWHYRRKVSDLHKAIKGLKRVLVIPLVTKYMVCTWEPTNLVYTNTVGVIASESNTDYALIQSTFHGDWARLQGSTLRNDQRYTPGDCFETFPFPQNLVGLDDIGESYNTHRQSIMLTRQEGLTKTYNRFHDPREQSLPISSPCASCTKRWTRRWHEPMAGMISISQHGFHETKQGLRYTISEEARREVLDRLLLLNHQRHEEEVRSRVVRERGEGKESQGSENS